MYGYGNDPDKISFRNVINDLQVSEWEDFDLGIGNKPTLDEFLKAIERRGLYPIRLTMRAYHNPGEGLILDYGLRRQIWIPDVNGWDLSYFKKPMSEKVGDIKLRPCACCGSKAVLKSGTEKRMFGDEGFYIMCTNEECLMNTVSVNGGYSSDLEYLIEKWNTRKPMEQALSALESLKQDLIANAQMLSANQIQKAIEIMQYNLETPAVLEKTDMER